MRDKHLCDAVRCSLENFGTFDYIDEEDHDVIRYIRICPLYALSNLFRRL